MVYLKDGSYQVKKSFTHLVLTLFIVALGSSWTFTWNIATDRKMVIDAITNHVNNSYIHDESQQHLTEKDLTLYLKPITRQLDRIEAELKDLK